MNRLKNILPITQWARNYKKPYLKGDVIAGLTVGVMLIPQGMAYALIAGLPPVYGLYASIVPQFIYALMGTSRQLSVAPVAMDSLLVASGVSVLAIQGTEAYIGFTIVLAFFVGLFQILLGIFKLGFITNLLSKPVISGFTSAAAFIIGFNQLKYVLGIDVEKSNRIYEIIAGMFSNLSFTHLTTFLLGVAGIVVIFLSKKINRSLPGALVAVVIGIVVIEVFHPAGVAIVGSIPKGFPAFTLPDFELGKFMQLIPLAMTIAVIAFMESFSIAKSIETKKKDFKVIPNQELIALGAANFIGSFFQSYPVAGGFSRSAVNYQVGANTQFGSIISGILVAIVLVWLTPLFYNLPLAILGAIIIVAVANLVDFKYSIFLWKTNKVEFLLLILTFLVTMNVNMVTGIITGIVLSILMLLYKTAYPHIAILGKVKGHHEFRNIKRFKNLETWDDLLMIRIDAPLNFINIQYFKSFLEEAIENRNGSIRKVIIDAGPINHIDATAAQGLKDILEQLKKDQITVLMCDLIGPVRDVLHRTGLIEAIDRKHIFIDLNEAIRFATTSSPGRFTSYALQSNISK